MKGILLPGKGIGIDAVEPNSPAEQVGLRPVDPGALRLFGRLDAGGAGG